MIRTVPKSFAARLTVLLHSRLLLLCVLAVWLVLAFGMIFKTLAFSPSYPRFGFVIQDGTQARFGSGTFRHSEEWKVDIQTGETVRHKARMGASESEFTSPLYPGKTVVWMTDSRLYDSNFQPKDFLSVMIVDKVSGDVDHHWESKPYRSSGSVRVMNSRFFVASGWNWTEVLDLKNIEAGWQTTLLQAPYNRILIDTNDQSGSGHSTFLLAPSDLNLKSLRFDLIRINEAGLPELENQWNVGSRVIGFNHSDAFYWKGKITSISSDHKMIETRSAIDGTLLESFPLPANFDSSKMNWQIKYGLLNLIYPGSSRILNLETKQWFPSFDGPVRMGEVSEDGDLISGFENNLSGGLSRIVVLHRSTNQITGKILIQNDSRTAMFRLIDSEYIAIGSRAFGITLEVRKMSDGSIVRTIRPFAWVIPALVGLLVGYGIWAIGWCHVSAKKNGSAWIDVVIIGGIPLVLMMIRIAFRGNPWDYRFIIEYFQGTLLAFGLVGTMWFGLGDMRLLSRAIPLGLLYGTLLGLLSEQLVDVPTPIWYLAAKLSFPSIVALIVLLILRQFGCRLQQLKRSSVALRIDDHSQQKRLTRFSLRDLFVLTFLASLLLALLRIVFLNKSFVGELNYYHLGLSVLSSQVVFLLILVAVLSQRRYLFWLVAIIVFVGFGYLYFEMIRGFIRGFYFWFGPNRVLQTIRILCSEAIALFLMLLPFRFRGWTLARPKRVALPENGVV